MTATSSVRWGSIRARRSLLPSPFEGRTLRVAATLLKGNCSSIATDAPTGNRSSADEQYSPPTIVRRAKIQDQIPIATPGAAAAVVCGCYRIDRQLWRIVGFRRHLYEASHLRKPSSRACPESLTNWSLAPSCCSNALSSPCATPQSGAGLCAEVSRTLWCDICGGLQPIPRRGHLQTTNIGDLFIETHHGRVGTASGQGW
jgi:hypothetical protein